MKWAHSPLISITLVLLLSGATGMAITKHHTNTHQEMALHYQGELLQYFIGIKTKERFRSLEQDITSLKQFLLKQERFMESFNKRDIKQLSHILDQQYRQRFITADIVHVLRFTVFDQDLNILAASARNTNDVEPDLPICKKLYKKAALRKGSQRLKKLSNICNIDGKPLFALLFPFGGLAPAGYLQIDVDLGSELLKLQPSLGTQIQIISSRGNVVHQSDGWAELQTFMPLVATYELKSSSGNLVSIIQAASDISKLDERLQTINHTALISFAVLIIFTVLSIIFIIKVQLSNPLKTITAKLRNTDFYHKEALTEYISCSNPSPSIDNSIFSELFLHLCGHMLKDPLTGVYNRLFFQNKLEILLQEAKLQSMEVILFIIDINDFTAINNNYGHNIADLTLGTLARRLRDNMRENDTLSRIGNAQFAILSADMDQPEAERIARTIINISSMEMLIAETKVNITVSVGMTAMYKRTDNTDSVQQQANAALLQAKNNSHSHVFWKSPDSAEVNDAT